MKGDRHDDFIIAPGHIADRDQAVIAGFDRAQAIGADSPPAIHHLRSLLEVGDFVPFDLVGQLPCPACQVLQVDHRLSHLSAGFLSPYDDRVCAVVQEADGDLDIEVARLVQPAPVRAERQIEGRRGVDCRGEADKRFRA